MLCEYVRSSLKGDEQLCANKQAELVTVVGGIAQLPNVALCPTHRVLLQQQHPQWRFIPCNSNVT